MSWEKTFERLKGERLAFEHAARLCKEYRAENKALKAAVAVESLLLLWATVRYRHGRRNH